MLKHGKCPWWWERLGEKQRVPKCQADCLCCPFCWNDEGLGPSLTQWAGTRWPFPLPPGLWVVSSEWNRLGKIFRNRDCTRYDWRAKKTPRHHCFPLTNWQDFRWSWLFQSVPQGKSIYLLIPHIAITLGFQDTVLGMPPFGGHAILLSNASKLSYPLEWIHF